MKHVKLLLKKILPRSVIVGLGRFRLILKKMSLRNFFNKKTTDEESRILRDARGYTLYSYINKDGTIDYEKYCKIQTEGNKSKIIFAWVQQDNIKFLAKYIKTIVPNPEFGLCHGTRRGDEQRWFRESLDCEVIGTEISDTAEQFEHTIKWDFHEIKPEWINAVDFIYSNSFDHTYDPEKCLNAWMSCLKKGGICIIEHSSGHIKSTSLDPFGADIIIMPYLITSWGKGSYGVREILDAPIKKDSLEYLKFIVIQNF
jgi:hypothetical protein